MKQYIDFSTDPVPDNIYSFIMTWKDKKSYSSEPTLSIGEAIELLVALSYGFHMEYSDGRFFNKILVNDESTIAWDGEELIDI